MKTSASLRLVRAGSLAAAIASLIAVHSVRAADLTWDNLVGTNNWNLTDANFAGPWANGNTAVFGGTAGSTITIDATGISATGVTFNVNNDIITQSGGNSLTLAGGKIVTVGSGLSASINAPIISAVGLQAEGGGILNLGAVSTFTGGNIDLGTTSANNTLNITGTGKLQGAAGVVLNVGGSTFGGNHLNVSTPGTSASMSLRAYHLNLGVSSSDNEIKVSNGAYYGVLNVSNGAWNIGVNAGANNNRLIITGDGSSVSRSSSQGSGIQTGVAGDNNYIQVLAGGYLYPIRLASIGSNGGDNNYVLISGQGALAPSTYDGRSYGQTIFQIGASANAVGNSFRVENGARAINIGSTGNQTNRDFTVGNGAGSNNNFLLVKGAGSTMSVTMTNPVNIGGLITGGNSAPSITDSTATGNYIAVEDNGDLTIAATTSLYVMGVNSQVKIGNGSGTSTLSVGAQGGTVVSGIYIKNADGLLNFNNGWLNARVTGNLVSGLGKIDLHGPAYIANTTGFANTISVVIEDTTSSGAPLIKEGAGTLTLNATNTYKGATTVHGGTLVANSTFFDGVISSDSALVLGRGGNFQFKGLLDTMRNQLMSGLTLEVGGNGISVDNAGSASTATQLDLRGAWVDESTPGTLGITRHGGTVDFKAIGGTLGTNTFIMTVQPNVNGILGAWATVNDGAGLACNDGTDSIIAYTGYTDITSGNLPSSASSNFRITATSGEAISLALATDVNTLTQNSDTGAGATIHNTGTLRVGSSGGILITPTGVALTIGATLGSGALTAGGGDGVPGELVLGNFSTAYPLTINSAITNNGAGSVTLTKSGGGEVKLMSTSSYTGPTYVGAGLLTCDAAGAIGSGPLTVSGGTLAMGTFSNQTAAVTLTAGAITGTGTLASTVGFAFNGSTATSCSAVLADGVVASVPVSVGLVKSGPGTATLGAANTYSGETRIDAGTLAYGTAIANAIGSGPVTVNGGVLAMGTNSDEVGAVTLTAGAITGSGTLTSTSGFTLNGSGSTYCTAILAGSGVGLVKSGTGTTTLTAANTYTGNTSIEEGTLVLIKDCLSDTSTVSIATGAFLDLNYTGTDTVKSLIIGGSPAMAGTYGSLTSTATHKSATFTGTGILNVTEGPAVQPVLTLSALPSTFVETAGPSASTGTVSIPAALGSDLVVDLVSSDPTVASVPASVTISSGATSMTFSIEAVNNLLVQSSRAATLTASTSGYINATTDLTVTEAGYANWKINNAGGQAANLDYDNDGVSNGVEFFMGATGTTFTPNPSVINGKVTWPYDANTANTGMTYQVMTSTNLVNWLPVDPQPVPAAGKLEYTLPTGNPARFVRLDVTTP